MKRHLLFFKSICLLVFILGMVSCKKEEKVIEESVTLTLRVGVYKNDTIQVFYIKKTDDSYSEELSIKQFVEGKNELQTIDYVLPVGVKPKNIRIDLGERANYHDSIRIENVIIKYKDLALDGSRGEYKAWFTPNENIYFDSDSLVYKFQLHNDMFDPQLNGNQLLNTKIVKLFPPDVNERYFNE